MEGYAYPNRKGKIVMIGWDVYIKENNDGYITQKHIDTVFFDFDCDAQYVHRSLIDHDGYSNNIVVVNSTFDLDDASETEYDEELRRFFMYPVENNLDLML